MFDLGNENFVIRVCLSHTLFNDAMNADNKTF